MPTQKEMIAQILQKQDKQGSLLTKMDVALRGPEYDEGDGGLIAEVHQNTKCIKEIKKKQNKIVTWGITIVGAINVAGIIFAIVKGLGG
jgi:hypothetical protein